MYRPGGAASCPLCLRQRKQLTIVHLVMFRQAQHKFTKYQIPFTIPYMSTTEIAYNQALDYLYSFVDYSLKHISELAKAEFNLDRMYALMEELGTPQEKFPIIDVAGTKGKGSVASLCASALKAAGS